MPPKKAEDGAAAAAAAQASHYGEFLVLDASGCKLTFEPWDGEGQRPVPPSVYLSLTCLGTSTPLISTPASPDGTGIYHLSFSGKVKRDGSLTALDALLNSPPVIGLHDASTNALLASAPLDLTPFGLGQASMVLQDFLLNLAPRQPVTAAPVTPSTVTGGAAAAVKPTTPNAGKKGAAAAGQQEAPAPPPPPTALIASQPCITQLSLRFMQRQKPEELVNSEAKQTGKASPVPAVVPAAVVVEESLLPEMQPYCYLAPHDTANANVITLEIQGPAALPTNLVALAEPTVPAANKPNFSVALTLPAAAGSPLLLAGSLMKEGGPQLAWANGGKVKRVMKGCEVAALLAALEAAAPTEHVIACELGKCGGEDKPTPGVAPTPWEGYHAWAPVTGTSCLLDGGVQSCPAGKQDGPGGTDADADDAQPGFLSAVLQCWPAGKVSALPPPPPQPSGKAKPGSEPSDTSTPQSCVWEAAGSMLCVRMSFARPLVPEWSPPAEPNPLLKDLVPPRDLHPPIPPLTPQQDLSQHMDDLLRQLAAAYQQHCSTNTCGKEDQLQTLHQQPEVAHKQLIRQLNKDGRYLAWRDKMKEPLMRYVKEVLGVSSSSLSPQEVAGGFYGQLYAGLTDAAHKALNAAADVRPQPLSMEEDLHATPSPDVATLLKLAQQCEAAEPNNRRAVALLRRRRTMLKDCCQAHIDVAFLAARRACREGAAHLIEAMEALHSALQIDPSCVQALAATTALYTSILLLPDSQQQDAGGTPTWPGRQHCMQLAVAAGHALKQATCDSSMAWLLLYLAYTAGGQTSDADACLYVLKKRQRLASEQPASPPATDSAGLLAVWQLANELCLAPLASKVMAISTSASTIAGSITSEELAVATLIAKTKLLQACCGWAADMQYIQTVEADHHSAQQPGELPQGQSLPSSKVRLLNEAMLQVKQAKRLLKISNTVVSHSGGQPCHTVDSPQKDSDSASATAGQLPDATPQGEVQNVPASAVMPIDQLRSQLELLLLHGDICWELGQAATLETGMNQATNQDSASCLTEARRWYQEALQVIHDQGWLAAANAARFTELLTCQQTFDNPLAAPSTPSDEMSFQCHTAALEQQIMRGLLRLSSSYLNDVSMPQCALDVATAVAMLWRGSGAAWSAVAAAAAASTDEATRDMTASKAWMQANTHDVWDGRSWEALATAAFRSGRYAEGCAGLKYALALRASCMSDPNNSIAVPPHDMVATLLAAASCSSGYGNYHEAVQHLKQALQLQECVASRFQIYNQLAVVYKALGDLPAAKDAVVAATSGNDTV